MVLHKHDQAPGVIPTPNLSANRHNRGTGGGTEYKSLLSAEEVGFEPTVPRSGTPVFETGPFNHSGTPPDRLDPLDSV